MIAGSSISNQTELAAKLSEKGFAVTQASISRDLESLGVVKLNGFYAMPPKTATRPGLGTVTLDAAGDNLIVGRCASGLASAFTVKIDGARIPEIAGTIAGDDTIFIAVKGRDAQLGAIKKIEELFN